MREELMTTIINDKGEECYEEWIILPAGQRSIMGLVVYYDMGW